MVSNQGRCINILKNTEFIRNQILKTISLLSIQKLKKRMIEYINYAWRKFNVRLLKLLRAGLENDKLIFSKFAKMLILEK